LQEFRLKLAKVGEDAGMARTLQMAALPREPENGGFLLFRARPVPPIKPLP
jgi:hypothetical protein